MKNSPKLLFTLAAIAMAVAGSSEPVFARGGGAAANIMNSPGYQRRLQESRQQLSPSVQPSSIYRRKARHRRH
jgi:hypothetical protein